MEGHTNLINKNKVTVISLFLVQHSDDVSFHVALMSAEKNKSESGKCSQHDLEH